MKKPILTILACILYFTVILSAGIFAVMHSTQPEAACRFYYYSDVALEGGVLTLDGEPGVSIRRIPVPVDKDADYLLHVKWDIDTPDNTISSGTEHPGVLTVLLLKDSQENVLAWLCGDWGDWYLEPITLTAGEYCAEYRYFYEEEELRRFLSSISDETSNETEDSFEGYDSFGQEGIWRFRHAFEMEEDGKSSLSRSGSRAAAILIGLGTGILIFAGLLLIRMVKSDKKAKKADYDERQQMVRGRAFKYAYFTMLAYYMILYYCSVLALPLPVDTLTAEFLGIIAGIIPFGCYSVWKDAYFRVNENKTVVIALFALTGILNTAIGIGNICSGSAFSEGKLSSMGIHSLAIGIMFLCLLVTGILKTIKDRSEDQA